MEYDEDSHTVVYLLVLAVAAVAVYWFVVRENTAANLQVLPPATELLEQSQPTVGPLMPTLEWPDAPTVESA